MHKSYPTVLKQFTFRFVNIGKFSFSKKILKESLLLRRGISLKVIYEKVKISNCDFCNNFHDYNETCKLFQNILNDVQTKGIWEIIAVLHNYKKKCILILYMLKGSVHSSTH